MITLSFFFCNKTTIFIFSLSLSLLFSASKKFNSKMCHVFKNRKFLSMSDGTI